VINALKMNEIKIFSPATVANVSCGFDVLGFPLKQVGDEMVVRKTLDRGIKIKVFGDNNLPLEPEKNVAGVVAIAMLKPDNQPFGIEIEIYKNIKPGSGLGSSAASAAGTAFALNRLLGDKYTQTELVEFAMLGEKLASGMAHADNVAPALFGNFTLIRSYTPLDVIGLRAPKKLYCTLIHPQIELRTEDSRKVVSKTLELKKAVTQLGNISGFVSALYTDNYKLIARSLHDEIAEPQRAKLIPYFDEVKKAALSAGALGAGISGSGPSIFALSKGKKNAQKVEKAMHQIYKNTGIEYKIFVSKIAKKGVREL